MGRNSHVQPCEQTLHSSFSAWTNDVRLLIRSAKGVRSRNMGPVSAEVAQCEMEVLWIMVTIET